MNKKQVKNKRSLLRKRARKKGIEFNLTKSFIKTIYKNKGNICPICYKDFIEIQNHPQSPSFDRIDDYKGYIDGNICIICRRCNDKVLNFKSKKIRPKKLNGKKINSNQLKNIISKKISKLRRKTNLSSHEIIIKALEKFEKEYDTP